MISEEKMYPELLHARFYDSRNYKTENYPKRTADLFEMSVYLENSGALHLNDQCFELHRGDVRFIKPGDVLSTDVPFTAYSILLRFGEENHSYTQNIIDTIPSFFHCGEEVISTFQNIVELFSSEKTGSRLLMNSHLLHLLHHFYSIAIQKQQNSPYVDACILYMHENFQKKITLDDLGALTGYSPLHVLRIFKKQTGKSPSEYLQHYRMIQARRMLAETSLSVSEIAVAVGFHSVASFQTLFKSTFSISPGKYRKRSETFYL